MKAVPSCCLCGEEFCNDEELEEHTSMCPGATMEQDYDGDDDITAHTAIVYVDDNGSIITITQEEQGDEEGGRDNTENVNNVIIPPDQVRPDFQIVYKNRY